MSWRQYFFGLSGRIERNRFWLGVAVLVMTGTALGAALHLTTPLEGTAADPLRALFAVAVIAAMTWFTIALVSRRLHDRDKSGWMLWLFWILPPVMLSYSSARSSSAAGSSFLFLYIPDIGEILRNSSNGVLGLVIPIAASTLTVWGFVEVACLRGSYGPNRFGPDPLGEVRGELPGQL